VETKRFVGSTVNVMLTWQTCSQRSSRAAGSKRRALAFYVSIRIWYMFWESNCKGESDLGLCTCTTCQKIAAAQCRLPTNFAAKHVFYSEVGTAQPGLGSWVELIKRQQQQRQTHSFCKSRSCAQTRVEKQTKDSKEISAWAGWSKTPRAGTGDSACRSWRYQCSIVLIRQGHLSIIGTFLIRSLPPPDNRG